MCKAVAQTRVVLPTPPLPQKIKGIDLRLLIPSPRPLSQRERSFCDNLIRRVSQKAPKMPDEDHRQYRFAAIDRATR